MMMRSKPRSDVDSKASSSVVLSSPSSVPLKRLRLILQREEEQRESVSLEVATLSSLVQRLHELMRSPNEAVAMMTSSQIDFVHSRLEESDSETMTSLTLIIIDIISLRLSNTMDYSDSSNNVTLMLRLLLRLLSKLAAEKDDCHKVALNALKSKIVAKFVDIEGNLDDYNDDHLTLLLQLSTHCLMSLSDGGLKMRLQQLIEQRLLLNSNPRIRISSMEIIHGLGLLSLSRLLEKFTSSSEPRERLAAFETLLKLHSNHKLKLTLNMYSGFTKALKDDFDLVRCAALKLVFALSQASPNLTLQSGGPSTTSHGGSRHLKRAHNSGKRSGNEGVRLVDDAFGKISNGVNDLDLNVRALAVELMGNMHHVSLNFLEQTLDKKLMSNLRVKKSAHQRTASLVSSGEWSSGKQFADDAPRGEVDASSVHLMSLGACGSLIHGLEDEFLRVRTLAVEALTKLSLREPKLASMALDFLVDMFNDEIELVRLKAIQSLRLIGSHISLHLHQLETILSALDDFNIVVRQRLHGMLQSCKIAAKDGLERVVVRLLENLKRYPQDCRSIMLTFKKLGSHHPNLTLPLVPHLLELHPFFDTPEMDVEDQAYVCILILVMNAQQHCPTMDALLDQHVIRHFQYLSNAFPHLVPNRLHMNAMGLKSENDGVDGSTKSFLLSCLRRAEECETRSQALPKLKLRTLERVAIDLRRLLDIEPRISGLAEFAALYVRAQTLTLRIVESKFWRMSGPSYESERRGYNATSLLSQLEPICLELSYRFHGLSTNVIFLVRCLDLFVTCLTLLRSVQAQEWRLALTEAEWVLQKLGDLDNRSQKSAFVSALALKLSTSETMNGLKEASNKPVFLANLLIDLVEKHPPQSLQPSLCSELNIRIVRAVIYEPSGSNETPLKYTAGMVLAVPLDAELFNVDHPELIRVAIRTPDQSMQLVTPKASHFLSQDDGDDANPKEEDSVGSDHEKASVTRLLTNALMSHSVWSEAMFVEVSLVLDLRHSVKFTKALESAAFKDAAVADDANRHLQRGILHLCKPVRVQVLPKGVKRGI